jgi:hypothetical protein
VNVLHAVNHDSPDLLERFEWSHGGNGVSLDEDVAVCKEFDRLSEPSKSNEERSISMSIEDEVKEEACKSSVPSRSTHSAQRYVVDA